VGLREHWGQRFPDLAHPLHALRWLGAALHELGDYGTAGMGLPLLLLAAAGLASLWRRDRALAALLVGPVGAGVLAAALRRYPFGDRLLFYAVPCLWLLAAEGLVALTRRCGARLAWLAPAALFVMALPETAIMAKHAAVLAPRVEFREALAFVQQQRRPGDLLWVAYPEVHEVYYGKGSGCLHGYLSPEEIADAVDGKPVRVWAVVPSLDWFGATCPEASELLYAVQPAPAARGRFHGVQVLLYEP
jgi:hypothetical protein